MRAMLQQAGGTETNIFSPEISKLDSGTGLRSVPQDLDRFDINDLGSLETPTGGCKRESKCMWRLEARIRKVHRICSTSSEAMMEEGAANLFLVPSCRGLSANALFQGIRGPNSEVVPWPVRC